MDGIEHLNADCTCRTLDRDALCRALSDIVGDNEFCARLAASHPHLISSQSLFLTDAHANSMQAVITAIEAVARRPEYAEAIAPHVPEIARASAGPVGVFMGYDFHLSADGPKLIEINTNAGGALINAYLLGAQQVCCAEMAGARHTITDLSTILTAFVQSFDNEWRLQGRGGEIERIAIVDDAPQDQYLYPEFVLFQRLFERNGIAACIAAPEDFELRDGALRYRGQEKIDVVYNRLTDFDLSEPQHAVLREAYRTGAAVITPNPWAYAHLADKRNLMLLGDDLALEKMGVPEPMRQTLVRGIPRTIAVTHENADELWERRNKLFFKPCTGFGSKAAYRGDKITRKVWSSILAGSYVAQDIVAPSARAVAVDGKVESLKADLRCYAYNGRVQLIAARLYSGQTTNFRTVGGGFAPVFISASNAECTCSARH